MTSRKLLARITPEPEEKKVPTNIGLEPTLKSDALKWLAEMNSNLSEFVAEALEVHLIAAGKRKPKKPMVQVIPELLKKK